MARPEPITKIIRDAHKNGIPLEITYPDGTFIKLPLTDYEFSKSMHQLDENINELEKLKLKARKSIKPA